MWILDGGNSNKVIALSCVVDYTSRVIRFVSVAQGIEQQPPKLWVAGSIPAWDVFSFKMVLCESD